jgi:hypothetical protein
MAAPHSKPSPLPERMADPQQQHVAHAGAVRRRAAATTGADPDATTVPTTTPLRLMPTMNIGWSAITPAPSPTAQLGTPAAGAPCRRPPRSSASESSTRPGPRSARPLGDTTGLIPVTIAALAEFAGVADPGPDWTHGYATLSSAANVLSQPGNSGQLPPRWGTSPCGRRSVRASALEPSWERS